MHRSGNLRNRSVRRAILSRKASDNFVWALLAALDIYLMTWALGIRDGLLVALALALLIRGLIAILDRRGIHLGGAAVFSFIATAAGVWHMPKPSWWERIKRRFK